MEQQKIKIGLPRAMLYYRYRILWRTFFQELGMETVVSAATDRDLLERGNGPGHRRGMPVAENLPGPRGGAGGEV